MSRERSYYLGNLFNLQKEPQVVEVLFRDLDNSIQQESAVAKGAGNGIQDRFKRVVARELNKHGRRSALDHGMGGCTGRQPRRS